MSKRANTLAAMIAGRAQNLREHVVIPVLLHLGLPGGEDAVDLLVKTAISESGLNRRKQVGGPALGLWQIEPKTHDDVWSNYLRFRPGLARKVSDYLGDDRIEAARLKNNDEYACAIARLVYWRAKEPLPPKEDAWLQAKYWKKHYNTEKGAGTLEHFLAENRLVEHYLKQLIA